MGDLPCGECMTACVNYVVEHYSHLGYDTQSGGAYCSENTCSATCEGDDSGSDDTAGGDDTSGDDSCSDYDLTNFGFPGGCAQAIATLGGCDAMAGANPLSVYCPVTCNACGGDDTAGGDDTSGDDSGSDDTAGGDDTSGDDSGSDDTAGGDDTSGDDSCSCLLYTSPSPRDNR